MAHPLRYRALREVVETIEYLLGLGSEGVYALWRNGELVTLRTRSVEDHLLPPPFFLRSSLIRSKRLQVIRHTFKTPTETVVLSFGVTRQLILVVLNPSSDNARTRKIFRVEALGLRERLVALLRSHSRRSSGPPEDDGGFPAWPVVPPPPFRPR